MTSRPERPARYPLLRGRRRGAAGPKTRRSLPGGRKSVAIGVLAVAALAAVYVSRPHAKPDPRTEIATSLGLLKVGNYSAARNHAQVATKAQPAWGLAHAVLARAYLALGEGMAAEGELNRAAATGFDMARGHQMLAEANLLQGDADGALEEAAKTSPRFAGYGERIRARALAAQGDVPAAQTILTNVLAAAPDDSLAWSDLGRIRADAGDVGGAADAASHALATDPNNLAALVLRGELVRSQYGLAASLPWFQAALKRDAFYVPALLDEAATLGEVGRYRDMLAATRAALAARPDSAQAFYLQAVLAARAGDNDLARTMLQRMGGAGSDMPGVLLLGGILDYDDGAYEQAIDKWQELVGRQPMNLTARRLLGAALLRSGDARGALDLLRPVALRTDADSYTLALVGRAFEATGQRDWAAHFLDRANRPADNASTPFGIDDDLTTLAGAAADTPGAPVQAVDLIRGLIDAGRGGDALARAQALVQASPGAPDAWILLGDTQAAFGRYPQAAQAYLRAADLRFDEPVMLRLVDAQERSGRRDIAAKALAIYLSQNPQSIAGARIAGRLQLAAGQWTAAIATFDGLRARIGSRDAAVLTGLAEAHLGNGDAAIARTFAKAAYALAPLNAAVADVYGRALGADGQDVEARQMLAKAVRLAPGDPVIRAHLSALER